MNMNLTPFFNQYLRDTRIPTLLYKYIGNDLSFKWDNVVDDFIMPVEIISDGKPQWIYPTKNWKKIELTQNKFKVDPNYYILSKEVKN